MFKMLERDIEGAVRTQVSKDQRQFYLTEQLKAIRKELGYGEEENEEFTRKGHMRGLKQRIASNFQGAWLDSRVQLAVEVCG